MHLKNQKSSFHLLYKIILFCIFFQFFSNTAFSSPIIYFASFEEQIVNGKITSSEIYLNPVHKSLNVVPFKEYQWSIITKESNHNKILNQAIKTFLSSHGNLYISSHSQKNNRYIKDAVNSCFQGYFLDNIQMVKNEEVDSDNSKKKFYFKAKFAPVASPDQWSFFILKNKFLDGLKEFKSFF